jgi:cardiolipin synthase
VDRYPHRHANWGAVLYVLFGDPTLGGRRLHLGQRIRRYYENAYAIAEADGPELSTIPPPFDAQARSIAQDSGFPVLSHNRYTILTDAGTILSSMVRDIDAAQSDCCLEFYIIDPSGRVEAVLDAVLRAAARGCRARSWPTITAARRSSARHGPRD